ETPERRAASPIETFAPMFIGAPLELHAFPPSGSELAWGGPARRSFHRVAGVLDRRHEVRARLLAEHVDVAGFEIDRDLRLGVDRLHGVLYGAHAVTAAHARDLEFLTHRCGSCE